MEKYFFPPTWVGNYENISEGKNSPFGDLQILMNGSVMRDLFKHQIMRGLLQQAMKRAVHQVSKGLPQSGLTPVTI